MGWLKAISEGVEKGLQKGRNVKGMFRDKK